MFDLLLVTNVGGVKLVRNLRGLLHLQTPETAALRSAANAKA